MTVTFGTPKAKPGGFPKPALKGALIVYLLSDYDEKAPSKWDPTSPKASVAYCIVVDSNAADQQVAPAGTAFEKVTWRGVLAAQAALVEVGEHGIGRLVSGGPGAKAWWGLEFDGIREDEYAAAAAAVERFLSRVSTAAGGEKAPPF